MESNVNAFRYLCFREFKTYVGKVSAIHEVIELAVHEFLVSLGKATNAEEFISEAATRHGLHVHFKQAPDILSKTIQLHIVNVHEAFEKFLEDFQAEIIDTTGITWKHYDKKSSLYIVLQNIFNSQEAGKKSLGSMCVELCEYYRLVRNEIIHVSPSSEKIEEEFQKVKGYGKEAVETYEKLGQAPNGMHDLTRDDFQLFIRVAQDVAWKLCQSTKPNQDQIAKSIEADVARFKVRWPKKPDRVLSAIVSLIEKKYGYDKPTAKLIASKAH